MNSVITNAAQITVLEPIDYNYKTGGGPVSVGGCCVIASKGKPFTPLEVNGNTDTGSNQTALFGKPLHKKAYGMEGLRHLSDASRECNWVQAVRVVNSAAYRFPSLSVLIFREQDASWTAGASYRMGDVLDKDGARWIAAEDHTATTGNAPGAADSLWLPYTGPVEQNAHRCNESVAVGEGYAFAVYPVDGDSSVNRSMKITRIKSTERRFTLEFWDKDSKGVDVRLGNPLEVGIDPDDKDDMGRPAYIESVLESQSEYFRCDFLEGVTWETMEPVLRALENTELRPQAFCFVGGTDGGIPELEDWMQAVDIFRNERIAMNLFFAAGCYEPDIIAAMAAVADFRHCAFFFDVPPYLNSSQALQWLSELGLKSRHARAYYAPYAANDMWRGGKTVWGVSGEMAAAKARCNAIFTKNVPGVHYSPAGVKRGYLSRTGVRQLFPEDRINRDTFVEARLNPVVPRSEGGAAADDDLALHFESNYLRFGWVNDICDYIDHRFVEAASYAKFEPDGLTRKTLTELTSAILEDLVLSGAVVEPRDEEKDGNKPYVITVEQIELDLWHVEWAFCPTGAARRIAGQPRLIR